MSVIEFDQVKGAIGVGISSGGVALLVVIIFLWQVLNKPEQASQSDKMNNMVKIAKNIQTGAKTFMLTEYAYLTVFVCFVALFIALSPYLEESRDINDGWKTTINFVVGASLSALAGYLGMFTAVRANVRTTTAATTSLDAALNIAFKSGCVMGLTVVGFGILGVSILFAIFLDPTVMAGFGFGASSIALFARVGGGIFTKAADVGADLCGKVAHDLDEDHPDNPAVIADNVGDNVGDVAGMGADLFESYVGSIIACLTLAVSKATAEDGTVDTARLEAYLTAPFLVAGGGIICSIIGSFFVTVSDEVSKDERMNKLLWAIRRGLIIAALLVVAVVVGTCHILVGASKWSEAEALEVFGCILIGLVAGLIIGFATEYCTSFEYYPTQSIALSGMHGHAPVIIQGMGVGMLSTVVPVLTVMVAILSCTALCGLYGVAIAGVGMLSTLGITLATDAYGPVADNAGGIAEMAELDDYVRENTDALDALGNTTAATGKGFAIGSAVLTAVALMASFIISSQIESAIDIMDDVLIPGVLVGAMLPFVFASLTMLSVRSGAHEIMNEVEKQFKVRQQHIDNNDLESWSPDHETCVKIATQSSVREMVIPGAMAVLVPLIIGFGLGAKALAGLLVGSISSGFLLAVTMANAGGAWDNAKKYVEAGSIPGHAKKSDLHKATVTGDTVGDPFKDTSGPSLNILIKLMSVISLVFAPVFPNKPYEDLGVALGISAVLLVVVLITTCRKRNADSTGFEKLQEMS